MDDEHRAAISAGRSSAAVVRRYLEALASKNSARGRRVNVRRLREELAEIEATIASAGPTKRLLLLQRRSDLVRRLATTERVVELAALEDVFVAVAAEYAERKGIGYDTWVEVGVPVNVLRRAGIRR
jgi:ribosomal protein L17